MAASKNFNPTILLMCLFQQLAMLGDVFVVVAGYSEVEQNIQDH